MLTLPPGSALRALFGPLPVVYLHYGWFSTRELVERKSKHDRGKSSTFLYGLVDWILGARDCRIPCFHVAA